MLQFVCLSLKQGCVSHFTIIFRDKCPHHIGNRFLFLGLDPLGSCNPSKALLQLKYGWKRNIESLSKFQFHVKISVLTNWQKMQPRETSNRECLQRHFAQNSWGCKSDSSIFQCCLQKMKNWFHEIFWRKRFHIFPYCEKHSVEIS